MRKQQGQEVTTSLLNLMKVKKTMIMMMRKRERVMMMILKMMILMRKMPNRVTRQIMIKNEIR
jgi:hypothetical protein